METTERIERLLEASARLADRDGADDASDAVRWTEIGGLAVEGLHATGIRVIDETRREVEEEDVIPLEFGWTSNPGEVEAWCDRHGMPWKYFRGKIVVQFDVDPGAEIRTVLKASGFQGKKFGRGKTAEVTWTHPLHGMWLDSKSGMARAYRSSIEAGDGEEQAQEAAGRCRKPVAVDERGEEERLAAAGSW